MLRGRLVLRLEQILSLWEDYWSTVSLPSKGPIVNFAELRKYLLSYSLDEIFDTMRFVEKDWDKMGNQLGALPLDLGAWTAGSRRVFHLSEELIRFLDQTSLGHLGWKDIHFPFGSFVITLDCPIPGDGQNFFDAIIVNGNLFDTLGQAPDLADIVSFRLLSGRLEEYKPISRLEKTQLKDFVRRKQWDKANNRLRRITDFMNRQLIRLSCPSINIRGKESNDLGNLEKSINMTNDGKFVDATLNTCLKAVSLVCKLCMYLDALPPKERPAGERKVRIVSEKKKQLDATAITDEAEIFVVKSVHPIIRDAMDKAVGNGEGTTGRQVCAHWRRAHRRRRKGEGKNPNAPKVVSVRACFVNRDSLPENALPSGSESLLL